MTSLAGEFETDLPAVETLAACAEAIHGLRWLIETVEGKRIVAYPSGSTGRPPKIEVELKESGEATDIRIIGSDTEARPLKEEELIAELNRARAAIEASVREASVEDAKEAGAVVAEEQVDVEEQADAEAKVDAEDKDEPGQVESRESGPNGGAPDGGGREPSSAVMAPPGWYEDHEGRGERWWDGERWTDKVRSTEQAPLAPESGVAEKPGAPGPPSRELLWGLSLGFGAVGGSAAAFGVPVISFYVPLGFGIAGAALAIAALTTPGKSPWWAILAVLASIAGIAVGVDGYSQYQDLQDQLGQAQKELDQLDFESP